MKLIHKATGLPVKRGDVVKGCSGHEVTVAGWNEHTKRIHVWTTKHQVGFDMLIYAFAADVYSCEWAP